MAISLHRLSILTKPTAIIYPSDSFLSSPYLQLSLPLSQGHLRFQCRNRGREEIFPTLVKNPLRRQFEQFRGIVLVGARQGAGFRVGGLSDERIEAGLLGFLNGEVDFICPA